MKPYSHGALHADPWFFLRAAGAGDVTGATLEVPALPATWWLPHPKVDLSPVPPLG